MKLCEKCTVFEPVGRFVELQFWNSVSSPFGYFGTEQVPCLGWPESHNLLYKWDDVSCPPRKVYQSYFNLSLRG